MKFHPLLKTFTALLLALILPSCASIVSKSNWPVTVNSNPSGLAFTITNRSGKVIHQAATPSTVTLKSGAGFFKSGKYTITAIKDGKTVSQTTLTAKLNGWYLGNIIFGGLIGILIVDPATGAMYALPEDITIPNSGVVAVASKSLNLVSLETLTAEQKLRLVRI